jgi:uncharacterized protein DUF4232
MRVTRTAGRLGTALLVAAATSAGLGLLSSPAYAATAMPASKSAPADAPSSCRPANHRAVVKPGAPSAGHRHYRVVLTAAPGYSDCTVAGAPSEVVFHGDAGAPLGVRSTPAPGQSQPVTFGPEHPAHFDIQVPNTPGGARASSLTFTLPAPGGVIPGDQEAEGAMQVDSGTQIGPIQPGE